MTILPAHIQRIIFHKAMASAHLIAAEFDCATTDVIDIVVGGLLTPETRIPVSAPSQPGDTSRSHAAAAVKTDEGACPSSLKASSSVDLSGLAAHEQGPIPSTDASQERAQTATGLGAGGDNSDPTSRPTATAKTDVPVDRGQASGGGQSQDNSGVRVASVDTKPKPPTGKALLVIKCHDENPDWPAKVIAKHLGLSRGSVSAHASLHGVTLPSQRDYDEAQKAKTTEALKSSPAKPQEAERPSEATKTQPHPEQPPATKSVTPRPVTVPNEPRRIVPTHAPVGAGPSTRFYVRDAKGRYLHQSLERSPTDTGPLMTSNRKWAWYDNAQRFAGACRKWPEIADMRKELPNA